MITMNNTMHLMKALGWQGGTIHQVSKETGLTALQILDLDTYTNLVYNTPRRLGMRDMEQGIVKTEYTKHNTPGDPMCISYWYGVLMASKEIHKKVL